MKLMINNKELFAILHKKYAQNLAANSSSKMVGYQPKKTLCSPDWKSAYILKWLQFVNEGMLTLTHLNILGSCSLD